MDEETLDGDTVTISTEALLPDIPAPTREERARTVRCLAAHATDGDELAEWLEMLDLSASEGS